MEFFSHNKQLQRVTKGGFTSSVTTDARDEGPPDLSIGCGDVSRRLLLRDPVSRGNAGQGEREHQDEMTDSTLGQPSEESVTRAAST